VAWNLGVALAWAGVQLGSPEMAAAGAAVILPTAVVSVLLLGRSLTVR
jgi:hypothetical protein